MIGTVEAEKISVDELADRTSPHPGAPVRVHRLAEAPLPRNAGLRGAARRRAPRTYRPEEEPVLHPRRGRLLDRAPRRAAGRAHLRPDRSARRRWDRLVWLLRRGR